MRIKALFLILILALSLLGGCANNQPSPSPPAQTEEPNPSDATPDAVTTASIVDNAEDFEKAISNTGTWIICLTKDISTDKELVLDGEFKNGKKDDAGKDIIQRKIALYAQDANRNITNRYTLTAPKLTINSPEASLQHGTFKGDLYVSAKNFKLVDTTVDGNVYFTNEDAQSTFTMDEDSKITGTKGMAQ
ncbi:MAG: hypothetical protein ACOX89_02510 [Lutispora sp.]|uniref:hypothetical protein n=1 Tax=Lutispora sp. TaxID=2828727 RepID=UPI0035620926